MERLDTLLKIPNLFNYKSLLNIGEVPASKHNHNVIDFFKTNGYSDITILEVWEPFANELRQENKDWNVICGDISIHKFDDESFDAVLWWHGPEHIEEKYLTTIVNKLKNIAKHFVIE